LSDAFNSTCARITIGAVLVHKGRIVSRGAAEERPPPLPVRSNGRPARPTHRRGLLAELHAIRKTKTDLRRAPVHVGRWERRGQRAMCRPCKACRLARKKAGVTSMFSTTPEGINRENMQ